MSSFPSLAWLRGLLSGAARPPRRPRVGRPLLEVEVLEDRLAPAGLSAGASFSMPQDNLSPVSSTSRSSVNTNAQSSGADTSGTPLSHPATQNAPSPNLAGNHPAAAVAYRPVSGTLFGPGGPSYLDVQQGSVGDCWLTASLAEVAARDPSVIQSMFTYEGTAVENHATVGVYAVRFYNASGTPSSVTVDTELPGGGNYYDHPVGGPGAVNGSSQPVLWVALAEKAYPEANGAGIVSTSHPGSDSYAALAVGDPAEALQAITGQPASDDGINPSNAAAAWNAGKLVVLGTNQPASSEIVPSHAYALVGYNASSPQPFEVFNPWGTQSNGWAPHNTNKILGLFNTNATFLSQNFSFDVFGTGKAAGEQAAAGRASSLSATHPQTGALDALFTDAGTR